MTPDIKSIITKNLVGMKMTMSLADYKVGELWKSFMPRRKEIENAWADELISMSVYDASHFIDFTPTREFEKWAAIEVEDFENVPRGMDRFVLPDGLYAVFHYKGLSTDNSVYQYIFGTWLPASGFVLDNRPHFEVLGAKYKNNDPESEEEIWIPIRHK
jgi:AraC family transcriptional regulator